MRSVTALGALLLSLSSLVSGAAIQAERLEYRTNPLVALDKRQTTSSAGCTNGPTTRSCWSNGYDINTNYQTSWPNTGNTVAYNLIVTNTTCNPDGNGARVCMLINGRMPGPTITANWGDTIRITVRNNLQNNGTSFHWHGIRQLNTNIQDGANGVTECAIAPGDLKTYVFQATQYGTSWYHSHFSQQYGDGVIGAIQINGPATANYDIDLGPYTVQDWYYITAFQAGARAFNGGNGGPPPTGNNILIQGTNKNAAKTTGAYNVVTLTPNKVHRLRIVNTAVDSTFRISLDGHTFTVIAHDFVPVTPYTTTYLQVSIGQRYDVLINANQAAGNYWFRATAEGNCQSANSGTGLSIFNYQGQTVADPTTTAPANPPTACLNAVATPKVAINVPSTNFASLSKNLNVQFGPVAQAGQNVFLWTVNGTSLNVDPGKPTVQYVAQNNVNGIPASYNIIKIPTGQAWTYWVVQQASGAPPIAHPIHLHGHDFHVLGYGSGTFTSANVASLTFTNPPRRDVAILPGNGWLVLAFPADNPGAWLMHCHIAFHVGMGLGVQFLERPSEISLPAAGSEWYQTCTNWNAYKTTAKYPQDDSGLKKRWPEDTFSL